MAVVEILIICTLISVVALVGYTVECDRMWSIHSQYIVDFPWVLQMNRLVPWNPLYIRLQKSSDIQTASIFASSTFDGMGVHTTKQGLLHGATRLKAGKLKGLEGMGQGRCTRRSSFHIKICRLIP